tara:strand:+ start:711 stop:860 length:150 start_codon:yes stop_codon:yes gene_type:complete
MNSPERLPSETHKPITGYQRFQARAKAGKMLIRTPAARYRQIEAYLIGR